jgi:DNA-binding protein H-NS
MHLTDNAEIKEKDMAEPVKLQKLLHEHEALEARIRTLKAEQKQAAIDEIKSKIAIFGLSIADLGLNISSKTRERNSHRKAVAPKFRNPETGDTWSGRGKPPRWIADKDRAEFVIS